MSNLHKLFVIFTFLFAAVEVTIIKNPTLKLVQVIFRHGDRTNDPNSVYPKDPYKNYTYFPTGLGELTLAGKHTMYEKVGKDFRKRYNWFLGEIYYPEMLEARSTDYSRTKASLLLVLAGIFPPSVTQIWEPGFNWQPIPITYLRKEEDKEFLGFRCPPALKYINKNRNSPVYKNEFNKYQTIADYVQKQTGWNITNFEIFSYVYFGLTSEKELELELPDWTKTVYPSPLMEIAQNTYYFEYALTDDLKQYSAGFMLKKILDNAYAKIQDIDTNGKKIHLLSGHEVNCATMLILLGVFKPHIPPYGAQVIFELHNISNVYGFMIYYQDYSAETPQILSLPNCGTFCPLDKFVKLYEKYIPDNNTIC